MLHSTALPERTEPAIARPVGIGIVADRPTTAAALAAVLGADPGLLVLTTTDVAGAERALSDPALRVLIVNLSLREDEGTAGGIAFIRHAKALRPDVGLLSLKRRIDEHQMRAALDAGADACCLAVTAAARIRKAISVVADGATWLDPEVARALFHNDFSEEHDAPSGTPHLSPRERQVLRLVAEGYTNGEIAQHLHCASPTVRTHLTHLYCKLGVGDRVSAAVYALRHGLT